MKVLYLDESGDHQLSKIDPQYPMFVLGGVIIDYDYAVGAMTCRLNELKRRFFGHSNIVLHTADITRNRNGFEQLSSATLRQEFYEALNEFMQSLDYKVVACAIRKEQHLHRYRDSAADPHLLSLDVLVEPFCMEIGRFDAPGVVIAEKRGHPLDRQIELAWEYLRVKGTNYRRAATIRQRITEITLMDKRDNIAGLQLADLVVSPIGRYLSGKAPREDFRIVESKFRRGSNDNYKGFGLVVLPKE